MSDAAILAGVPVDVASRGRIAPQDVSGLFLDQVPIGYARQHHLLALSTADSGRLHFLAPEPIDHELIDLVANWLGVRATRQPAEAATIDAALNAAYGGRESGLDAVVRTMAINGEVVAESDLVSADGDLLDNAARAPVIKLVNLALFEAVKRRASDVHVQPYADRVQVRLRIDGMLYDFVTLPVALLDEVVSRIKVIGRMDIAEKRIAQDGRTTVSLGDREIDLRISSLPTSHGERVVLRLLDKSARRYRLPELGMTARDLGTFRELIQHTHGIILVTGPTGSGKSTTLYAALQELNSRELNILTLEDPIEYQLDGISQTQVSDKKGMTFATGLRTVLRQDPDIIMVGEIRDEETARMAIQSSLTGHVVFSTLHTNDASSAVARLLDLGVEPYLVASSLLAVIAQRLIRRVCPACRQEYRLTEPQRERLGLTGDPSAGAIYAGRGCAACLNTGYWGRIGIFEQLVVTDAVRGLITQRADAASIRAEALRSGLHTLRMDAVLKLLAGQTTVEEVLRVTHEPA